MDRKKLLKQAHKMRDAASVMIDMLQEEPVSFLSPTPVADSPVLATIKVFIERRLGVFACDMASATEMSKTLRDPLFAKLILTMPNQLGHINVGRTLSQLVRQGTARSMIVTYKGRNARVCIFRNLDQYVGLAATQVAVEYEDQHRMLADGTIDDGTAEFTVPNHNDTGTLKAPNMR